MILLIFVLKVRIYVMSSLLRNSPFISQRSELADWQDVVTIVSHHHLTELGHHRQVPAQHLHQSELLHTQLSDLTLEDQWPCPRTPPPPWCRPSCP